MRVRLVSGGRECLVGRFVGEFVGGVCRAIAGSLKAPAANRRIELSLEQDRVELRIDGRSVALDGSQGFAATIVADTIRGMVRHLKDVDADGALRIEVDL